ncbi:Eco57I restriction-modification methylase domain-containing protein [Mucilaginibacter terrae]
MKQNLKIFLNYITGKLTASHIDIPAQEISTFLAIFIAKVTLSHNTLVTKGTETSLLKSRFPDLHKIYLATCKKLPADLLDQFSEKINNLVNLAGDESEKLIAWAYQFLKRVDEKAAFGKIGHGNAKIEGRELLLTTQFFTDDYMVRYLVDECLKDVNAKSILNTVVIDCASGGGNFLLYSYEVLRDRYQQLFPEWGAQQITDTILNTGILGYDLDPELSRIASLALFVRACRHAIPAKITGIYIFGGIKNDKLGFLAPVVQSSRIRGQTFNGLLKKLEREGQTKIWLTNPPFMGKRDMDIDLKQFLFARYPESKSDLCVSFLQRIVERMGSSDVAGLVAQNNWMYLSSLKGFRKLFLSQQHLRTCVDLGTNAFEDINGEKTNIALLIIGASVDPQTSFVELRQTDLSQKRYLLATKQFPDEVIFKLNQQQFVKNHSFEFNYQFEHRFNNIQKLETYGNYGNPMQGTSTGDNANFVKFAWEVNGSPDWKLVSKGGGFSKWAGLNYYKVYWGENAEKVKANKGSALRNISKMALTQLVYSDTGTLGLNVRVLKPGQVFIASGPGIQVHEGNVFAHMAFLNSRVATFLLKKINPKFTISAGYIAKLPVAPGILNSKTLAKKSSKCLNLKEFYLAHKLPNFEFRHIDYQAIDNVETFIEGQLLADLESDYQRLHLEADIENEITKQYNFNPIELNEIHKVVGANPFAKSKRGLTVDAHQLDNLIASSIDINCLSTSRTINGFSMGSESIFEDLAHKLDVHPSVLLELARKNISLLKQTKVKYYDDLLHKIVLYELGVKQISIYKFEELNIDALVNKLLNRYHFLPSKETLSKKIDYLLNIHHKLSFFNKPLISMERQQLTVGQAYHE